jgi:indolepyruvate ferredoxin oxidoreductase alpha subunit
MSHPLLSKSPGEQHLLLGNEAIVRGAVEAGIGFVSCYPGTPSSEVPDTFFRISPDADYYFEYSVNEKVAMEVAGGAALSGVPTMVTMKHVGVNVAADPFMTLAYIGTPGGLIVLSADDPGCHSSQNEQDNRYYARLAGFPCFEPATAQEAKDMTRDILAMSARWEQPVMLRTTTRVNHLRGPVAFDEPAPARTKGEFKKNPMRFVPIPAVARKRHDVLLKKLEEIREEAETSPWNTESGSGKVGFIASGIARAYLNDVLLEADAKDEVRVLELGFTYPLPTKKILSFLNKVEKVVILEELEPLVENEVRTLIQKNGLSVEIVGKGEMLPVQGEYSTVIVRKVFGAVTGREDTHAHCDMEQGLPMRPPNLCAGCPHRAAFYAVRETYGDEAVYSSDIGCYTLGILPPLKAADFLLCMGSSVSSGTGVSKATGQPVVAYIGDSTFYHSGITGLINAVFNGHDLLLVILDNRTTAMTGHQPNPGVDTTFIGPNPNVVDIETIVRGCGVTQVKKVKPLNHKATKTALDEFKAMSGVRVLIAVDPCPLFAKRALGKKPVQTAYVPKEHAADQECLDVVADLACPAFSIQDGNVVIDETTCSGCMFCVQLSSKIKARKRSLS